MHCFFGSEIHFITLLGQVFSTFLLILHWQNPTFKALKTKVSITATYA